MAFDLKALLRPHIANIKPYSSARDEYSGKEGIFLDANENPFGSATAEDFNRYPDPYQWAIKEKLAIVKDVRPNQIFIGNGSDEAIDLLIRAFCRPGKDNVILLPPTYGMYEVSAEINDIQIKKVNLSTDYQLRPDAILAATDEFTKIIFICSPNNPSGNKVAREDIRKILENFKGLVVVDEAYTDFSDEPSFTTELDQYPNLLVMQTFSKAWGLASLRLGMAFASAEIIKILNLIKPPYNISGLTQQKALEALEGKEKMESLVKDILLEREYLWQELTHLEFVLHIYPSHANFLLVKVTAARKIYDFLIDSQIIVRDRSKVLLCDDCLRISVGTREENVALIKTLKKFPVVG
ncbi:histidinol-phosphate aminotransferase [Rhodonellum psychrophilum GCM71 = DSM 17998]|uniref:Histidinol-phosphate aminotransferase n=2 Tax=Rhodonellum TaxID=336827 RepID=U5BTU9_9BACT|nr:MULTISPECIES: histidinol-phosphate transaminase [Rhodonellum]ERM80949.1 histidinol-phosphate aminotransferase [Rhodonellum psychrophilum GCM71 = DSM 17998]SDY82585.1 histidinol phosphate aminotransferase apoenzyme [Rhodonellum ikkaensis]